MFIVLAIFGILFMVTFIFIGIWSFIILTKVYDQIKYKNYLIEKINHNLSLNNRCNNLFNTDEKSTDSGMQNQKNTTESNLEKAPSHEGNIYAYDSETLAPHKKEV